jgi:hypothetical protein
MNVGANTRAVSITRLSSYSSLFFSLLNNCKRSKKIVEGGRSRSPSRVVWEPQQFASCCSFRGLALLPLPLALQSGWRCRKGTFYKHQIIPFLPTTTFSPPLIPAQFCSNSSSIKDVVYLPVANMATLSTYQKKHKIAVIGSGNW